MGTGMEWVATQRRLTVLEAEMKQVKERLRIHAETIGGIVTAVNGHAEVHNRHMESCHGEDEESRARREAEMAQGDDEGEGETCA